MWSGIDRRKFPRAYFKCVINIFSKDSPESIVTHTENIGIGGICVIIPEDLGLFRGVNLEVELQDGGTGNIVTSGTVVWVVKKHDHKRSGGMAYDTGIEFVDLPAAAKAKITKIVETQLKKDSVK